MKYQLNTKMTDEDYYKYNIFMNFKSWYGKKQMVKIAIMTGVIFLIYAAIVLVSDGINQDAFIRMATMLAVFVAWIFLFFILLRLILKWRMKSMKKSGKLLYSPTALIEFYDDCFVETTEVNKTENKYSAIDRISVIQKECTVYIHINAILAHIIPFGTFDSKEKLDEFVEFIKTKCDRVDFY